ncbi:MAG TPA: hypothetical protein DEP35_15950 [Deltaproteobacteria bacterium]|nr:hypothetical protein [Deltaproteobacteria bacterium]
MKQKAQPHPAAQDLRGETAEPSAVAYGASAKKSRWGRTHSPGYRGPSPSNARADSTSARLQRRLAARRDVRLDAGARGAFRPGSASQAKIAQEGDLEARPASADQRPGAADVKRGS